jgi:hypothetical protein
VDFFATASFSAWEINESARGRGDNYVQARAVVYIMAEMTFRFVISPGLQLCNDSDTQMLFFQSKGYRVAL